MTLSPQDIGFLINLVKTRSGISLTEDKLYLFESRLLPVAKQHGMNDMPSLIQKLRAMPPEKMLVDVTEAMTTNESFFFRDNKPFDYLRQTVLPTIAKRSPGGSCRIWSAACSTGQEPYSIAMSILEETVKAPVNASILATDLANHVLEKAKSGIYSQFEVQRGVPITLLLKYFTQQDTQWKIKDNIRQMVSFDTCNLMNDFSHLGKFDIIFCRNVLIYFDAETKSKVLQKMQNLLHPEGILFLGGSESVFNLNTKFKAIENWPGTYRLE